MKDNILCIFIMLFVSVTFNANAQKSPQGQFSVKGVLVDSLSNEGEPYSTIRISLKSNPAKPVKLAVTDTNGKFSERLVSPGTYLISFSSVGKRTVQKEFTVSDTKKVADLGHIQMAEATEMLKGVEVVAQKPLVKAEIDKVTYSIEDDPDSKTNSTLEMLRKVPLVTVDGEDKIQVNGSSNFKVHVNGKPNNMMSNNPTEVLKSLPANSVKSIEVITDPGAKYDAEGVGGIYWGRYIYRDLYAFLTPEEIVGTMTACGVDGYTSYGMNGLDDGGVLNRMEDDFLDSLRRGNTWCAEVIPKRGKSKYKEIAILFPSEMSDYEPFDVENNEIRRLDMLGWYEICCDLGYQTDVISYYDILENKLNDYKMLIVPSNDCYFAEEHTDMEKMIREWVTNGGVVIHGPDCGLSKNCFGIQGIPCEKTPYIYQKPIIPQGCEFQRYETGRCISAYADDAGKCIVMQEIEKGKVISCGVQLGASYVAKNIPHVPYEQRNKEMYPIIQARSTLLEDLLGVCGKPVSGICERGIETGVFETGMVLVNHRSTPYDIGNLKGNRKFTNPVNDTVLLPHSAVWVERE